MRGDGVPAYSPDSIGVDTASSSIMLVGDVPGPIGLYTSTLTQPSIAMQRRRMLRKHMRYTHNQNASVPPLEKETAG